MRVERELVAVFAVMLATCPRAVGGAVDDGRSERDLATERFLEEAPVAARTEVGEGITRPSKLTLVLGDDTRHAIFKTIDERGRGPTLDTSTNRIVNDFSDSWRHEVAAYRLDRALGFGLVPVTAARRLDGVWGSVQEWIEECGTFRDLVDSGDLEITGDIELLLRRLTWMYVLDELIANADRNYDNILVDPETDRFALIDHSRAFRTPYEVVPPSLPEPRPVSSETAARLRRLDRPELDRLIGDLLTPRQLEAVAVRRDALLVVLDAHGLLPDAD
jgi:hypothetical protein